MSSANRGTIRQPNDHYDTPDYTIQSLLDVHQIVDPVFEPCAGNLAIVKMLNWTGGMVKSNDINDDLPTDTHYDYTRVSIFKDKFKTIITNPPYNIASDIIEKAVYDVVDGGEVIMLLRLNFLGSQKRKVFWKQMPLKHIYVLSKRPSFIGGKTDSTEYAWFIFEKGYNGSSTIEVI